MPTDDAFPERPMPADDPNRGDLPSDLFGLPASLDAWPAGSAETQTGEPATGEAAESYWTISRRPLTSLVFTLPLVLAYEGGVLVMGRGTPRNGADVWLRTLLDGLGFGQYFLLPALTVLALLAWHHVEHDHWRFSPGVLAGMAGECLLWAVVLLGIARLQDRFWPLAAGAAEGVFARLVAFCGAGLYEEVLFRLLLLPLVTWIVARLGATPVAAAAWGVVGSSLLFSAAHYFGPLGDIFDPYSFTFRFLAGVFFAALFELRGFGIAAGSHAAYDILVGISP
ncbi:MAG: CPBP family intramembrane metalloprotease [Planctomycetes bacterium]|nr:CPBP family intramembrane metalloprotease [Planctomycetota bacterium]